MAADPTEADARGDGVNVGRSSMDRATEVLSQLHFVYSRTKPTSRQGTEKATTAAASPHLSLEQRYEQWKRFWQSIDTTSARGQHTHSGDDRDIAANDGNDTERLLRWLAFSRQQQTHTDQQTDGSRHHTAASQSANEPQPSSNTSCPHSPTYYVNLARFLSSAPPHRQRLRSRHTAHTVPTKTDQPQQRQDEERAERGVSTDCQSKAKQKVSGAGESERVEIIIDCSDDQHVAHRYVHRPTTTTSHSRTTEQPTASSECAAPSDLATPSSSPPLSRPSSAYSFTNLPREHIRPAASTAPKASFSLHSYFARMSVSQLQRYLHVFNPSLLSSSFALTKEQLISICCTFYRTCIASHRSQPPDQRSEQLKRDAAKDAIVAHTNRTYAQLSLPALLHTIAAATTLASAPAVLSGVGYVDERSVRSGYRRCMLRVHPDKHTLSGWEEQTRCVELFRLVQDKYAYWQRVAEQR